MRRRALCFLQFLLWRRTPRYCLLARPRVLLPTLGGAASYSPGVPFPSLSGVPPLPQGKRRRAERGHPLEPRALALRPRRRGSGRPCGEPRGGGPSARPAPGGRNAASGWSQRAAPARAATACALRSPTGRRDTAGGRRNSPLLHPPPSSAPPPPSSSGDTAKRQRAAERCRLPLSLPVRGAAGAQAEGSPPAGQPQSPPCALSYPREGARQAESGAGGGAEGEG